MKPHEAIIAKKLIALALERGHALSVNDGEEWTIKRSTDAAEVFAALGSTDEDLLLIQAPGLIPLTVSRVLLVYGNEPGVLISDYSCPPATEEERGAIMKPMNALADEIDALAAAFDSVCETWTEEEWTKRLAVARDWTKVEA